MRFINKIFIILFLFVSHLYSQKGLYLKLGFSPAKISSNFEPNIEFESLGGSRIWIKPDNLSSDFGLAVRYNCYFGYQSEKYFAEIGLRGDGAITAYKMGVTYYSIDSIYVSSYLASKTSVPQAVISLRAGFKIFERDSGKIYKKLKYSLFLFGALESKRSMSSGISGTDFSYSPDGINSIHTTAASYSRNGNFICGSIGLNFLVNTRRNKNLFAITLHYGFRTRNAQATTVFLVTDIDKSRHILGSFDSYGSGLILELNKNLYASNFFKRKIRNR